MDSLRNSEPDFNKEPLLLIKKLSLNESLLKKTISDYISARISLDLSENIIIPEKTRKLTKIKNEDQERNSNILKYELIDEENLEKKLIILEEENSILLNPYLIPPNIDIALMHQKANKFGFEPEESKIIDESIKINNDSHLELKINEDSIIKSTPISDYEENKSNNLNFQECPCCFESLNKQKLNFFFDSNEIEILGPAYPIFLKMLKTLLFFIIIPYFFSVFIPHIIYLYFECGNVNSMSLCNSGDEDFNLDLYLQVIDDRLLVDLLFSIYFSIVVTIFRIKAIRFLKNHEKINNISQFTLMVKNIPQNEKEYEILQFFKNIKLNKKPNFIEKFWQNNFSKKIKNEKNLSINIEEINMIYNLNDFIYLEKEIMRIINQRRKNMALLYISEKFNLNDIHIKNNMKFMDKNLIKLIKQKNNLLQEINNNNQSLKFMGQIFISFETHKQAKKIYNIFNNFFDSRQKKYKNNNLIIEWAAEPEELIWENIAVFSDNKWLFRLISFFAEILLLFFIGFIINQIYHSMESENVGKELGVAILILFVNKILSFIIKKLISLAKHKTKAKEELFTIKTIFPFILINIILYELFDYIHALFNGMVDDNENFIELEKIIHKVLFVSIFVSLIEPFLKTLLNFSNLYKLYMQYKLKKNPNYNSYCQKEVNLIFEPPIIELSEFYFDSILIFVIGVLGSSFYPPCFLITGAALFLIFLYFKYLIVYRCKVEPIKDDKFLYYFARILNLSPLFYIFGTYFNAQKLLFIQLEENKYLKPYFYCFLSEAILILIVSYSHTEKMFVIKMDFVTKKFGEIKNYYQTKNYSQIKAIFAI